MLIHIVHQSNAHLYRRQLDAMHRLRWAVYVEERGWAELAAKQTRQGYERDEYDDEHAHYLIAIDEEGEVLGAMRLRPADETSMMGDLFPHLIDGPPQFGPGDWELTRLMRAPLSRARDGTVRLSMNCALIEFCIGRHVERLIAVAETFLLPMTRQAWGAKMRPLGLPQPYAEGEAIALALFPDNEALAAMRAQGGLAWAQLYEHCASGEDPVAAARAEARVRAAGQAEAA